MSLRVRLVLTVVGLLALALVITAGATFGAIQDWRGPGYSRLLGLNDERELVAAAEELSHRVAMVMIGTSGLTLAALAVLAAVLIRRGLRPLDRMVETATAIGAGDLSRRVDVAAPDTEVGRLGAALNNMLSQLERAFRERETSEERLRRFVADASHELRTPVATIRGYAELFRRGAASRRADLEKAMHRIESEAARMGDLVEELLLLARLDQGRPMERTLVDLSALVADAVADTRAIEPGRPLTLDCADRVLVLGDPSKLRQALGNLLVNVIHHTPAGTPASVRVKADGERAMVEVADQGPGLTEEQRQLVFERFYRVERAHHAHGGGTGLGLAIVAAVIAAHGGEVSVDSRPGQGATFRFQLPRTTVRDERDTRTGENISESHP